MKESVPGALSVVVVHGGFLAGWEVRQVVPCKAPNFPSHFWLELCCLIHLCALDRIPSIFLESQVLYHSLV